MSDLNKKLDRIIEGKLVWVDDFKKRFDSIDGRVGANERDIAVLKSEIKKKRGLRISWNSLVEAIAAVPTLVHIFVTAPTLVTLIVGTIYHFWRTRP